MKDVMFHTILSFFLHIHFEDVNVLFYILGYFAPIKCVLYCTFNLINANHTIMGNACCVTLKLILFIPTDLATEKWLFKCTFSLWMFLFYFISLDILLQLNVY